MEEITTIKWLKDPKQAKLSLGNTSSCLCTFYNNGKANIMMVDNVQTDKNLRNHGFGTKLLKEVLKFAKKMRVESIELVVSRDNLSAKRIYEKVGMKLTNKDYYRIILIKWKT